MAFSKLAEEHHFGSLQFSSTHTYMNSPTDRITVVSANDDDVEYFDLSFPESGGKSGNYFRRVVKIRIPVAKTHVFWNGAGSPKYEFVVKTDSNISSSKRMDHLHRSLIQISRIKIKPGLPEAI
ncbi:uncharacterized protein DFL_003888 [Arthrobotrys flagrans]|uniref:Uncharacterized protein n=1 Tax=Arthrobotrys flagrans TaxID=97331 RepID=A0A437A3C6_ARTFL|nr:hypothetical protein DFL_003888 [Arthrobotrys flagrans]